MWGKWCEQSEDLTFSYIKVVQNFLKEAIPVSAGACLDVVQEQQHHEYRQVCNQAIQIPTSWEKKETVLHESFRLCKQYLTKCIGT